MTVRWAPPLLALAALLAASHHGAAQAPARSVVQLLDPGSEPRVALRYATPLGAREAVMLTTRASTRVGMMGFGGGQSTPLPGTRVLVEVGPIADAGADRLMVPFRFTAVDALPTEGVSAEEVTRTQRELQPLVGLEGFQLIDRQGVGTGVDLVIPPGTSPALAEQLQQLRRGLRDMFAPFPSEPVGLGAVWEVRTPVQSHGVAAEQITTYRLRARAGDEIGLDVQIAQTAPAQALPDPQPGLRARLESLATTGSGTMELKLSHLVPAIHWSSRSVVQSTVSVEGFEQPMRAELDLEVWLGLP
ncbi:MAG: hypothetical protein IPG17_11860 [Sandaracinaceae bacterium]|nr:hypothetical protein [Sandaracinaceae bacterium]